MNLLGNKNNMKNIKYKNNHKTLVLNYTDLIDLHLLNLLEY